MRMTWTSKMGPGSAEERERKREKPGTKIGMTKRMMRMTMNERSKGNKRAVNEGRRKSGRVKTSAGRQDRMNKRKPTHRQIHPNHLPARLRVQFVRQRQDVFSAVLVPPPLIRMMDDEGAEEAVGVLH
jgi:hypothetical protein